MRESAEQRPRLIQTGDGFYVSSREDIRGKGRLTSDRGKEDGEEAEEYVT